MRDTKVLNEITKDIFVVSDLHLGHRNILDFEPSRKIQMEKDGFSDHELYLIHNWNQVVKEQDTVLCLGDFAFTQTVLKSNMADLFEKYNHMTDSEFKSYIKSKPISNL